MKPQRVDDFNAGVDYPVYVLTAATGDGRRGGCLVGFATQCSIEPARYLVCVSKQNHTHDVARDADVLALHVLDAGQRELARLFGEQTGDDVDKFAACEWRPGPGGVPVLAAAPRRLIARVLDRADAGDHVAFLLEPVDVQVDADARPLMYRDVADFEPGHPA